MPQTPLFARIGLVAAGSLFAALLSVAAPGRPSLTNERIELAWSRDDRGWRLERTEIRAGQETRRAGAPSGEYTFLYSPERPSTAPMSVPWDGPGGRFPEASYRAVTAKWGDATTPVALNIAGEARRFFPQSAERSDDGSWVFGYEDDLARVRAVWSLDSAPPGDIRVVLTLTAKQAGWFSMATPTLISATPAELEWAVVPGCFQGTAILRGLVLTQGYGQGLPDRPVLARERVASTLASILTLKNGATLGVVAEPGTGADPWAADGDSRQVWQLGLSHMNRAGQLAPTLYHPVLGEKGSQLGAGESRTFRFRYTLGTGDWVDVLRHAAYDVYRLADFLALKQPARSLSERLVAMRGYVTDDETSHWRTAEFDGRTIGAQEYRDNVVGPGEGPMKNSDYGAMWMLAMLTDDPRLVDGRLPLARAFKLVQQQTEPGFFQGAAIGQYYLSRSHRFIEEWGGYVEPVGLTYYTMLDLGNILLFTPQDRELRDRLRLGAECLLRWQQADGHWEVAYDRATQKPVFTDLRDLRPTFYGLLVAYRVFGDDKYLAAARRGADWLLRTAVDTGAYLGVCGDTRFAPDFATAQIAQALLDLHEITGDPRYREAGIRTGRQYLTSIYTHPVATLAAKTVERTTRADWEINQTGLGYEHGTSLGSTNGPGPILLASHAGLFLRLHQLTGEPLFRDLARAGVWARDAFVDPATSVASYYWRSMDRGPGAYPHHAWWQIGWITDYLLSEAALRSDGAISFPRGFITPKVGPHATYGFAPGKIFGEAASLDWGRVETGSPAVDYVIAKAVAGRKGFVVLLNDSAHPVVSRVRVEPSVWFGDHARTWRSLGARDAAGRPQTVETAADGSVAVPLPAAGLAILTLEPSP